MIPSDPGIKCGDGFSAFSRFFGWRFEPFLLFRYSYTTAAGIMQGEPGQRRTAVHLVHRSARIFHWPFSCRSALLCRFKVVFFAVTPRPICGAGSVSLSCKNDFRIEISTAAYFLRRTHFFYRTLFLYCSSFLRRPHFLRGGVFLWVSLGDVEKGFGIMDKGIVIRRDGAGVSAGDCGFVGRIRRFLRKKEKYAENILLFCTFYWYQ